MKQAFSLDFVSWACVVLYESSFTSMSSRSLCTLVCKWTYCPPDGWDPSFWISIGLEDLVEDDFSKIGNGSFRVADMSSGAPQLEIKLLLFHPGRETRPPGSPLGDGLTQEAAAHLGLDPGTAVGASLIDAHAGGLGTTTVEPLCERALLYPTPGI